MSDWFFAWLVAGGVIGAVWLFRLAIIGFIIRRRAVLHSASYDGAPRPAPPVTVLVAAKDEEANIEPCVASLLQQDYPNLELIAIDDRSTDQTPAILQRFQDRAGDRLRVVTIASLPQSWFGKNHAMHQGVAVSRGEWLCFTDADCRRFSPRAVSTAVREAVERDVDFLSITPVLETTNAWEKITQPVCTVVLMLWFLPEHVNNPARPHAYANGAFMLMRRSCYDAIGGHEAVRTHLNEDIALARRAKQRGFRLRVVENEDLYRTRMYRGKREAFRGWSRIFYGCLETPPKLAVAALMLIVFTLGPWLSFLAALTGWLVAEASGGLSWKLALGVWGTVLVAMQATLWRVFGIMKVHRGWSLCFVGGAVMVLGMLCNAMLKAVGATGTTWRGTTYPFKQRSLPREAVLPGAPLAAAPVEETAGPA
ncbi:MAG: glycosyltransferase [Planctomycetes bacterium]|nr:glycosyltransferase [Planctomycetota bacterium]